MPRKSKPQSTTVVSPGQPYGIAGDQQAAMATIPLPNNDLPVSTINASIPSADIQMPSMQPGSNSNFADVLNAAVSSPVPGQGAFSAPTTRPNQSMTEVVNSAPAVPASNPTIQLLETMASNMGNDPAILETINRLKMQGV